MAEQTYTIQHVAEITGGHLVLNAPEEHKIKELLTDSRKTVHPDVSLFFALSGERHDGHRFVPELIVQGVRNFVVSEFPESFSSLLEIGRARV